MVSLTYIVYEGKRNTDGKRYYLDIRQHPLTWQSIPLTHPSAVLTLRIVLDSVEKKKKT